VVLEDIIVEDSYSGPRMEGKGSGAAFFTFSDVLSELSFRMACAHSCDAWVGSYWSSPRPPSTPTWHRPHSLPRSLPPLPAADESGKLHVTLEFVRAMLAAFKEEQLIHRRYAFEIILQVSTRGGVYG